MGIVLLGSILLWWSLQKQTENPDVGSSSAEVNISFEAAFAALAEEIGAEEDLSGWPTLVERPIVSEWENLTAETTSAVEFVVSCMAVDFTPNDNKNG